MPTGFILAGLRFFGTAAALGLALVALAPIGGVRLLGLVGLACAVTGLVLHALCAAPGRSSKRSRRCGPGSKQA